MRITRAAIGVIISMIHNDRNGFGSLVAVRSVTEPGV